MTKRLGEFDRDFLQPILKYSTIFSVFAKNLRVVSSNLGHEDFLLYAFLHWNEICTPFRTYEYKDLK